MTIEKSHHYLPQGYLKYFADENGKLNQHFKNNDNVHLKLPSKVGFENHLYKRQAGEITDTEIEKYFHNVEEIISQVLSKFLKNQKNILITEADISRLIWFFSTMFWRQRKAVKEYAKYEGYLNGKPSKNLLYAADLHQNILEFNEFLLHNYILFFQISLGSKFILAENGIVIENDYTKSADPIGFFLPLNPMVMMSFTKKEFFPKHLYNDTTIEDNILIKAANCSEDFVDSINHWAIHQSERYYYSAP